MQQCICQVFKSRKKAGAYVYVEKKHGLSKVPAPLLELLGECQPAMVLLLQEGKKLAVADVADVLKAVNEQGFYLQMPSQDENEMKAIAALNNKLGL